MNVLIPIWSLRIGGAESFVLNLAKYLNQKNHKAYIFPVVGPWDYQFVHLLEKNGVEILSPLYPKVYDFIGWKLNAVSIRLFGFNFRSLLTKVYYKYIIKRYSFDCIISNSLISDEFIYSEGRSKVPLVIVEHGDYSYQVIDSKLIPMNVLRNADQIVCVSKWSQTILQAVSGLETKVIYNGHTKRILKKFEELNSLLQNSFVFGMIGRSVEYKGWKDAIKSFLLIQESFPNSMLILIGDGEYIQELKQEFGENPKIVFAGKQNEPQNWIQYIDVGLVLTKKYETFGLAILDFFEQGKPVIATNTGGIPEVVCHESIDGGIIVEVENDGKPNVNKVAGAMLLLATDHELRMSLSRNAEILYKRFSFDNTGAEYLSLIQKVVNQSGRK